MPIAKETLLKTGSVVAISAVIAGGSEICTSDAAALNAHQPEHSIENVFDPKDIGRLLIDSYTTEADIVFVAFQKSSVTRYHSGANDHSQAQKHKVVYDLDNPYVPPILKAIGGCESGHDSPTSGIEWHRPNDYGSSASGGFQIEDPTWANFKKYPRALDAPPAIQVEKAEEILKQDGTEPWASSEYCWGPNVNR